MLPHAEELPEVLSENNARRLLKSVQNPLYSHTKLNYEMVQRPVARHATNCNQNTSSVADMLQELDCESLESGRVKMQLTLLLVIQNLVDIPASTLSYGRKPSVLVAF